VGQPPGQRGRDYFITISRSAPAGCRPAATEIRPRSGLVGRPDHPVAPGGQRPRQERLDQSPLGVIDAQVHLARIRQIEGQFGC